MWFRCQVGGSDPTTNPIVIPPLLREESAPQLAPKAQSLLAERTRKKVLGTSPWVGGQGEPCMVRENVSH